jgi:DNA (cytosine-5)-methyltransferase 1
MAAYYNEIDPYAAQWLRNLIAAGHIAFGDVDERSIEDVRPDDLRPYTQCHFFAGVGVWSHALRLAGWSDDRPVWTGSCPCQPFSAAGKGAGFDDERHLWPAFHWLIGECRPPVILGEQVASKDAGPWIDLVHADLEAMGYAFGAIPFPAAGVGAPNIRDRLYWGAHSHDSRLEGRRSVRERTNQRATGSNRMAGGMADAERERVRACGSGGAPGTPAEVQGIHRERERLRPDAGAGDDGLGAGGRPVDGFWRTADWLACRDGKWRPVEPGSFPLAHGATARVGRLRAYGNAINAEAARHFILATGLA